MKSVEGKLLIAIPDLTDPNFFRSVVLVVEHNENGAMGVVLNRPSDLKLEQLWTKLDPSVSVVRDESIHIGGPVHGPLIALHDKFSLADKSLMDGVAITMSGERMNDLVNADGFRLKIFNGYSGWGPGQLDQEIQVGGWLVNETSSDEIFGDPERLWKSVSERFGNEIIQRTITTKPNFGGDPNLN